MKALYAPPFLLAETMAKSIDAFEAGKRPRIHLSLNAASVIAIPDHDLRRSAMRFVRRVALVLSGKGGLADTELSRFVSQTPSIKGCHKKQERLITASVTLRWLEKSVQLHKERPASGSKGVFKDLQTMGELFVGLLWHEAVATTAATEEETSSSSAQGAVQVRGLRMVRTVGTHFWLMDMDAETGDPQRQTEGLHKSAAPPVNGQAEVIHYAMTLTLRHRLLDRKGRKRVRSGVSRSPSAAKAVGSEEPRLKKQKQPVAFRLKMAKVVPLLKRSPQWDSVPVYDRRSRIGHPQEKKDLTRTHF